MSRHGTPPLTAQKALEAALATWSGNPLAVAIGQRIQKRLQTSLMNAEFSQTWLDPILRFINDSAQTLQEEGDDEQSLAASLIVEVAAIRFESLEFETRYEALAKMMRDLDRRKG